jgi:hypothetical protein
MKRTMSGLLLSGLLLSACTGPAVSKAVGTGAEATPIVVTTTESAVVIENHTGRPLLNVRVAVEATGAQTPFVRVVPSLEAGQSTNLPLNDFRNDEGVVYDPATLPPKQATVTARDTLAQSYDVIATWK